MGTTVGDMVTQIVTDYIDLHNKIFHTWIAAGHNGAGMGGTLASSFVPKELSGLWQKVFPVLSTHNLLNGCR